MKKLMSFCLMLLMVTLLSACGSFDNTELPSNKTNQVNFDLSQYENHGELSEGLIWVEKTTSSYDQSPKTSFAYLDVEGNIKSPWFDTEEFSPSDFVNGLVILKSNTHTFYGAKKDLANCVVYDTDFNKIADGYFKVNKEVGNGQYEYEIAIIDANEKGEIFGFAEIDGSDYGLFKITKNNTVRFPVGDDAFLEPTVSNLKRIEKQLNYYVVDIRSTYWNNSVYYMGVFDESGNKIFEPSEQMDYDVWSIEVLSDTQFQVRFQGKDSKFYTVKTDSTGTFLDEPQLD